VLTYLSGPPVKEHSPNVPFMESITERYPIPRTLFHSSFTVNSMRPLSRLQVPLKIGGGGRETYKFVVKMLTFNPLQKNVIDTPSCSTGMRVCSNLSRYTVQVTGDGAKKMGLYTSLFDTHYTKYNLALYLKCSNASQGL
jgi:hypothetical protein